MVTMLVDTILLALYLMVMPVQKMDPPEIRSLYEGGMSTLEIAKMKNVSISGVGACLRNQGVQMRGSGGLRTRKVAGFTPTRAWMLEALPAFDSASAAAHHYGVPYPTWIDWMIKFDIPRNRWLGGPRNQGARQEIPIEEAVRLSNEGTTYQELADRYDVSYGVIFRRMKEVGHSPPWRRAKDPRFKTHSTKKRKVLQEIGIESCEICGEDRTLDFAHIKPAADGGPIEKENCLVLCPTHHRLYDGGLLSRDEFQAVLPKVRAAEALYLWTNGFYGGW